jgi:hypothetical protein
MLNGKCILLTTVALNPIFGEILSLQSEMKEVNSKKM